MMTLQTYLRRGHRLLRRWAVDPRMHTLAQTVLWTMAGFFASAASLCQSPQPVALGLVCVLSGWDAVMAGLGGMLGYLVFWGEAGLPCLGWMVPGLVLALTLGGGRLTRDTPLFMPSVAAFLVAAGGVAFQVWLGDETPIPIYLLRVALAAGVTALFVCARDRREPATDWLVGAVAVLALAQVNFIPYLGFGFVAAGLIGTLGAFPAAALAGLGLDLAQVTQVPMSAVLCLGYLTRFLPGSKLWLRGAGLAIGYLAVMSLSGNYDLAPLPGLVVGGALSAMIPGVMPPGRRRGETGVAQVRLEMASEAMLQAEGILLESSEPPLDGKALILRATERACGSCPCRKNCRDQGKAMDISPDLFRQPLLRTEDLPFVCRKPGRLLLELQRSQEQLRQLEAGRDRLREYRGAVVQQYRFLAEYLRELSDRLGQRPIHGEPQFSPQVAAVTTGRERADGDRCLWFAGTGCRYYVILCDGMGTGLGAAQESGDAVTMLRRLLSAGYPAEHALRSLNSLCALRDRAGAVTVDLLELRLDTGKAALYKWGAAPSYLISSTLTEKIGTASPPPGLSVMDSRETVERLSLRRGETLVLLSDGVDGEVVRRRALVDDTGTPGEVAARILEVGCGDESDDASVIAVRLSPAALST